MLAFFVVDCFHDVCDHRLCIALVLGHNAATVANPTRLCEFPPTIASIKDVEHPEAMQATASLVTSLVVLDTGNLCVWDALVSPTIDAKESSNRAKNSEGGCGGGYIITGACEQRHQGAGTPRENNVLLHLDFFGVELQLLAPAAGENLKAPTSDIILLFGDLLRQ